jgi:hypothetical protein
MIGFRSTPELVVFMICMTIHEFNILSVFFRADLIYPLAKDLFWMHAKLILRRDQMPCEAEFYSSLCEELVQGTLIQRPSYKIQTKNFCMTPGTTNSLISCNNGRNMWTGWRVFRTFDGQPKNAEFTHLFIYVLSRKMGFVLQWRRYSTRRTGGQLSAGL